MKLKGNLIEDETILIECDIESEPQWKDIQWFQGSTHLMNQTNQREIEVILHRSMNGIPLCCQVKNDIGMNNQSIHLNISCKKSLQIPLIFSSLLNECRSTEILQK